MAIRGATVSPDILFVRVSERKSTKNRLHFVGARLISVDLHEHVADAQGRALVVGNNDLDLFHDGHYYGMIIDAAAGLLRANRNALRRNGKRPG